MAAPNDVENSAPAEDEFLELPDDEVTGLSVEFDEGITTGAVDGVSRREASELLKLRPGESQVSSSLTFFG